MLDKKDDLQSEYYDIIDFYERKITFSFKINWNIEKISGTSSANGYIVQKVKQVVEGAQGLRAPLPYYEAWRVINGKCEKDGYSFDDEFGIDSFIAIAIMTSGIISYYCEVYWIDKTNSLYECIDSWPSEDKIGSGTLKSIEVSKCIELDGVEPIFKRPIFEHKITVEGN